MALRIAAFLLLAAYLCIYFGKMLAQRRRGIRTNQLARGKKTAAVRRTELVLQPAVVLRTAVQLVCIALAPAVLPAPLRVAGLLPGLAGILVFFAAVHTMRDSWRAGIPAEERTQLITSGVYRYSRNPAYLGFFLLDFGILLLFFHPALLLCTVFSTAMIHVQVKNEEAFLEQEFGEPYRTYCAHTRRYCGRVSPA